MLKKGCRSDSGYLVRIFSDTFLHQIYIYVKLFENNHNPKMQIEWASKYVFCNHEIRDRNRSYDPWNTRFSALPSLPRVHHFYDTFSVRQFVDYLYNSLRLTMGLLQCNEPI